ncbi:hypothetical protein M8044_000049 [Columbia Basin potato purple top phytoplasma]|uniref:Uncharacterized protein n=1 Tax=Columbia Basin potato purple top phytoplasma TaxID=307134 RepID=A0ABT5L819_9MOLU|nr:hypothetical protein [Columbia Basin potato purple top phytoplasma]
MISSVNKKFLLKESSTFFFIDLAVFNSFSASCFIFKICSLIELIFSSS